MYDKSLINGSVPLLVLFDKRNVDVLTVNTVNPAEEIQLEDQLRMKYLNIFVYTLGNN